MYLFKNYRQKYIISPSVVCFEDLKILCLELYDLNEIARRNEIANIQSIWKINEGDSEGIQKEKREKISLHEANVNNYCVISIKVEGDGGEWFSIIPSKDLDKVFSSPSLPAKITRIAFDNWSNYQIFQTRLLNFKIDVELSFKEKKVLDFNNDDSLEDSFIEVVGLDETWVLGAIEKLRRTIEKRANIVSRFLYKYLRYNTVLWLIGIPGGLLLMRFLSKFFFFLSDLPRGLAPIFFLTLGLLILLIFRVFYNYVRWMFPYMEIVEQPKSAQLLQRTGLTFLILSLISGWLSLVIEFFMHHG